MTNTIFLRAVLSAAVIATSLLLEPPGIEGQPAPKSLVAVWAHADDEAAAAPVLARYARQGVQVFMIIVTDGAQGGSHTSIPRGQELARARAEEARCSAEALGARAPILLDFPDGQLGSYMEDPERTTRVAAKLRAELEQLHPDALISWGPDGGTGHPDHRLVSSILTQLVRAGAPGATDRLFYASIPVEGMRAMNPSRGEPAFLIPVPKYFSTRVSYSPADLEASIRAMACHKTQYTDEVMRQVVPMMRSLDKGALSFSPAFPAGATDDLFGK